MHRVSAATEVGAVAVSRPVAATGDAPPSRGAPVPSLVSFVAIIVILPTAIAQLIPSTVAASSPCFSWRVRLPIPPEQVPASLTVWWSSLTTIAVDEGQVLHNRHMQEDLVGHGMLEASWLLMMKLHERKWNVHGREFSVRISDCERNLLRDLARVRTPSPQVVGPCPLPATGVLLHIVDCTGAAQDQGSHVLPPGMRWDPLDANIDSVL